MTQPLAEHSNTLIAKMARGHKISVFYSTSPRRSQRKMPNIVDIERAKGYAPATDVNVNVDVRRRGVVMHQVQLVPSPLFGWMIPADTSTSQQSPHCQECQSGRRGRGFGF